MNGPTLRLKHDVTVDVYGYELCIPKGTRISGPMSMTWTNGEARPCFGITANPDWITCPKLRIAASHEMSMFRHDAVYRYAWVDADHCERIQ